MQKATLLFKWQMTLLHPNKFVPEWFWSWSKKRRPSWRRRCWNSEWIVCTILQHLHQPKQSPPRPKQPTIMYLYNGIIILDHNKRVPTLSWKVLGPIRDFPPSEQELPNSYYTFRLIPSSHRGGGISVRIFRHFFIFFSKQIWWYQLCPIGIHFWIFFLGFAKQKKVNKM